MVEPRWEVKIGSPVMATDTEYGRLEQLILDPHQERVLALIVRRRGLFPTRMVVIPVVKVADATEKEVLLHIALDQVDTLPEYQPASPSVDLDSAVLIIQDRQQLFCEGDQPVGKISLILMNPDGRVTGVVVQVGYIPRRKLIVPVGWIADVVMGNIYLSVLKYRLENLPEYRPDDVLEIAVDNALFSNEILRNTDYPEIGIDVQDGIVELRGHVFNFLNKNRAEEAISTIPGILCVESYLVVDQELATEVAQALSCNNLTASEKIMAKVEHGFVTLTGQVSDTAVREAAETAAASLPQVRGIANFLRAPGMVAQPQIPQFWQPRIGEEVYATDTRLGDVEKVVINPNNRCVTAFVTHINNPDLFTGIEDGFSDETTLQEHDVVIPTRAIVYDGGSAISLLVSGASAAQNRDVSSCDLVYPPESWQPPYPYDPGNVLFERKCSAEPNESVLS